MVLRDKNLPIGLVREIVSVYEEKELERMKGEQYDNLKAALFGGHRINCFKMQDFINQTKSSVHTHFHMGKDFNFWNRKIKDRDIINYDLKSHDYIYINLLRFTEKSYQLFRNVLMSYRDKDYLIINLEDNTGGNLNACLKICRLLLYKEREIVTMNYNEKCIIHKTYTEPEFLFKKIYVIVNKNTASSSEIMALALRLNMKNVVILGVPTFCKGVGQENYVNKKYKYVLSLTSYRWSIYGKSAEDLKDYIMPGSLDDILLGLL